MTQYKKNPTKSSSKNRGWYDVQDQKGIWRLGKCISMENKIMRIRLDGWSSKNQRFYCEHSQRVAPPRTHTRGYTTQQPMPLRQPLEDPQIVTNTQTKLKLLLDSSLSTCDINEIITFFRVQLFVLVDSILTLPYDFQNHNFGLQVNKLFIEITNLNIKMLSQSSSNLQGINNQKNLCIHKASYQIFLLMNGVFGLSTRYNKFFKNQQNIFIKSENCIDCFLKSPEGGIKLINNYLKNIMSFNLCSQQDFQICSQLILIVLQLFGQRYITQNDITLKLLIDTIIKYIGFAAKNQKVHIKIQMVQKYKYLINTFQNVFIKLRPGKSFPLTIINPKKAARKGSQSNLQKQQGLQSKVFVKEQYSKLRLPKKMQSNQSSIQISPNIVSKLQERLQKLQKQLQKSKSQKQKDLLQQYFKEQNKSKLTQKLSSKQLIPSQSSEFDFNQLSFLNTLQYHLANNSVEEVKKLINWRKKIIQLSTIVGWDIALIIAKNTQDKLTVETKDILSTNINYLKKFYSL